MALGLSMLCETEVCAVYACCVCQAHRQATASHEQMTDWHEHMTDWHVVGFGRLLQEFSLSKGLLLMSSL